MIAGDWLLRTHPSRRPARPPETRFLFVKSWNEWAEGKHLEPDSRFGRKWLEALAATLKRE